MTKIYYTLIAILCLNMGISQQDKHFSMFFANQVQFNPGAAGHHAGDLQIFTNYRTQWFTIPNQSFRTISATIDGKLLDKKIRNGFLGAGVNFTNDVSGDGKYSLNTVSIPINYSLEVGNNAIFSLALQPGAYSQSLSGQGLNFHNQWDGSQFNSSLPTGENIGGSNITRFDIGAGLYMVTAPSRYRKFEFGVSGFHLSKQKVSFYGLTEKLYRTVTAFGKADLGKSTSDWSVHPAMIALFQGPNREITIGSNFEYELKPASKHTMYFDGMSISFGTYYRVGDAFIGNIIYNAGALSVGISYDANLSGFTVATKGVGAAEIYLKFNPSLGSGRYGAPRIH